MPIRIVKTVAVGTIATLGLAAVVFTPAAYASTSKQTATPHLAVLTDKIAPVRRAA
ncbi:hypothetical protein GCM10009630_38060 [Kribbella jejuensis]|uniref:Uncharacterized protein n=1 Tax=Kribbella jejuensis TaxID=236068 RepID=A0A542ESC5_9ACTN|nr:hypothetical protein [Kribbella jejuensis]TQJ18241.1 hypothetical protein FB475_2376 [Kribbella jejuensis]